MSPNSHYQHDLVLKAHLCIQSVSITLQVKNNPSVRKKTRVRVTSLDVVWRLPFCLRNLSEPGVNLASEIRMLAGVFLQFFSTDDLHAPSASTCFPHRDAFGVPLTGNTIHRKSASGKRRINW